MKILMRNIGMTLHVIHTLRRQGLDERPGEHGLAAPDHERREPRRVRGAARRRGPARPPARELRLGDVRRRQHGRGDRVHGDARARADFREVGYGVDGDDRLARVRPVPVHRGPGRRGRRARCKQWRFIDRVGLADRRATRWPRPARARTRSAPTSWCTRRSARELVPLVGLDVGTSSVKGVAVGDDGAVLAVEAEALPVSRPRAGLVRAGPRRLVGGHRAGARRGCEARVGRPRGDRAERPDARPGGARRRRPGAATGDPVERPAHRGRGRGAGGAPRRRRGDGGGDRQPDAHRVHRAEARLGAPTTSRTSSPACARCCCPRTTSACGCAASGRPTSVDASGTGWFDVACPGVERRAGAATARASIRRGCPRRSSRRRCPAGRPEGVPVAAGAGDQGAGALGVGAVGAGGPASVVLGTSGVVCAPTGRLRRRRRSGGCRPPATSCADGWFLMGVMLSAAGSLAWLSSVIGAPGAGGARRGGGGVGAGGGGPDVPAVPERRAGAAPRPGRPRRVRRASASATTGARWPGRCSRGWRSACATAWTSSGRPGSR